MSSKRTEWRAEDKALPQVRTMHAYVPGKQPVGGDWIKLNTNELPYPASPAVAAAVAAEVEKLRLYPNPLSQPLREHIAAMNGLLPEQVFVGNGCDEVLALLTRVFSDGRNIACMTQPSYSLYPVLTQIQAAQMQKIPFARDMKLPVEAIRACTANLLFLTNPNAPTGVEFAPEDIRTAAEGFEGVFVIDETYADFARHNAVAMLAELPNIVITRSLSKSYGLAGLRLGYALASAQIVALLDKVRDSYNVNRLSQAGALAALKDEAYHDELVATIKATRESFRDALLARGFFAYPSSGNFVFAEPPARTGLSMTEAASSLFAYLEAKRILVRYFPGDALTESFLRISIGRPEQMDRLLQTVDQWLSNE